MQPETPIFESPTDVLGVKYNINAENYYVLSVYVFLCFAKNISIFLLVSIHLLFEILSIGMFLCMNFSNTIQTQGCTSNLICEYVIGFLVNSMHRCLIKM